METHKKLPAVIIGMLLTMFAAYSCADGTKIGVVNIKLLLEKSPQAQKASKKLETEFLPKQQALQKLITDLRNKQKKYEKNKLVMSKSQQEKKERTLTMLARDIQRKQSDLQEELNLRRNNELMTIQQTVNKAIKQVGVSKKFDLILYEGIAYTTDKVDITKEVLSHLKKKAK